MSVGSGLRMKGSSPARTIRYRIVSLVLVILLPLLALAGWFAYDVARARTALIEAERTDSAETITAKLDSEIALTIGALMGLTSSDDLRGNANEFRRQAAAISAKLHLQRVWTFDHAGTTLVETGAPREPRGNVLIGDLARGVFEGKRVVSPVFGERLEHAVVLVAVPVLDGGAVSAGVAAELPLSEIAPVLRSFGLPTSWVVAIVDRNGRFVARSLDSENRVGTVARPELKLAAQSETKSGTFRNVTLEGTPMVNSYRRSSLSGWTTVVAVPVEIVNAPLRQNALLMLLVGGTALVLSVGAALGYATRISEPVRTLGQHASAMGKGGNVSPTRYPLVELEEVQTAFESATAESAHLAALVASSGDAIMSMELDGTIRTWNPAAELLFGYKADEIIGRPKALLVPPERLEEHRLQQARVVAGESVRCETVRWGKNGTRIAVSVDSAPIRRLDGRIIATSSILHDITERIADEEHRRFLMREIAHRSKNQLAIIQSIAAQTARSSGSIDEFLTRFRGRLQGLSASHDLLLNQNWHGAPLDGLVRSQMQIFVDPSSKAIEISGPPAMLSASAAEAIGLALHELATNSAKYGALSVPTGKVEVVWGEVGGGDGKTAWELTWREKGGPPVKEPSGSGFGTQVIKRMAAMAVQGSAELEYPESGVLWRLTFPPTALRPIASQQVFTGQNADAARKQAEVAPETRH